MTRTAALEIAKTLYAAYRAADTDHMFGRTSEAPVAADYCYRHGWIVAFGHSFNSEELTGVPYDINQGGWAWV